MARRSGDGRLDALDRELQDLLDAARRERDAAARRQRYWLTRQAQEHSS